MADEELYRRWQVAQLTRPLHLLAIRSAAKADFNHARYDLVQLALRAIDYVVTHQASMTGTVTPDELVAYLAQQARQLSPDDPDRPWTHVAKLTLANLLNDGRPLRAQWSELAEAEDEPPAKRTYSFRLLRLLDTGDSAHLSATDEAVMLYLQALDVDLADREAAARLILRRQMEAGEFDRARRSAVDARRTAEGLAASLRDRLDETRRDLRGVDWTGDVPAQLQEAHRHVTEQLELDRHILELAERGIAQGSEREREACRVVVAEVRRGQEVHTRLEQLILSAIPVYLEAQAAQRLNPTRPSLAIDLETDLLFPFLRADEPRGSEATEHLVQRLAVHCRPAWTLDTLVSTLLRPPAVYEKPPPAFDDPGELDEAEERGLPADIEAVASAVFRECHLAPRRLSELAALGAQHLAEVADGDLLLDVIHLAAAGRFISSEGDDEQEAQDHTGGLPAVLEGLISVTDQTALPAGPWLGDDLLVGRASDIADYHSQPEELTGAPTVLATTMAGEPGR